MLPVSQSNESRVIEFQVVTQGKRPPHTGSKSSNLITACPVLPPAACHVPASAGRGAISKMQKCQWRCLKAVPGRSGQYGLLARQGQLLVLSSPQHQSSSELCILLLSCPPQDCWRGAESPHGKGLVTAVTLGARSPAQGTPVNCKQAHHSHLHPPAQTRTFWMLNTK